MRRLIIFFINVYQATPLSTHKNCKFIPTCSEYSKQAYEKYGFFYGSYLTLKRLLKCVPWNHDNIYDPLKEEK